MKLLTGLVLGIIIGAVGIVVLGPSIRTPDGDDLLTEMMEMTGKAPAMKVANTVTPSPEAMAKTETPAMAAEGTVKEFTVTGSNFKFDPAEIKVAKGDKVKVTFKSAGMMHDFVIDEFNVKTKQLKADEEETVEFTADKAGTFEYYCSVGKHRQMGMVGKLVVE